MLFYHEMNGWKIKFDADYFAFCAEKGDVMTKKIYQTDLHPVYTF